MLSFFLFVIVPVLVLLVLVVVVVVHHLVVSCQRWHVISCNSIFALTTAIFCMSIATVIPTITTHTTRTTKNMC